MADQWDQFPDAPKDAPASADPWAQFPDAKPAPPAPAKEPSLLMAPIGGAEMLAKRITGAVASIPAGVAYGGAAVAHALGSDVVPSDVQNRVQNFLTYEPHTASGQAGERTLSAITAPVVKPIVKYADKAATEVGKVSPFAETLMREAPAAARAASAVVPLYQGVQAVKNAVATNAETRAMADMTRQIHPTPEQEMQAKAQSLNIKLLPSQQERSVGAVAEGISGQAKLERTLSKQNAKVVDAAAADEIGLPEGVRPTPAVLAQEAAKEGRVYDEVGRLGKVTTDQAYRDAISSIDDRSGAASFAEDTPASVARLKEIYGNKASFDAADAVAKVRQLRADASKNIKALNAPEQNALGYAQRKLADVLDDQMERAAQAQGLTDLVSRYKAARVRLAKIHSVQDAIRGQNVSAKALASQLEHNIPLSGKLRDIAELYGSYDRVLQDVSKLRNTGPLDVVDYLVGAGAAVHNPAAAAAALSRPAIRAALASNWYQSLGRGGAAGPVPPPAAPLNALAPAAVATGNALTQRRTGTR
jgi:hypothetical protein